MLCVGVLLNGINGVGEEERGRLSMFWCRREWCVDRLVTQVQVEWLVRIVCNKLYYQDIQPERFLDVEIDNLYPEKGYHRMYIGEIEKVLTSAAAEAPPG